ncbi:MAG: hypothetical protein U1E62_12920 [Alsobacter sp.]
MPSHASSRGPVLLRALLAASAVLVAPVAAAPPAFAEDLAETKAEAKQARPACLSEAEIREEVAAKRVIAQVAALRAARAAGGGEAVRARLCNGEKGLVYVITSLKRDGKVLRIDVDAATGRIVERN